MTRKLQIRPEPHFNVRETDGSREQSIAEIANRIRQSNASLIAIDGLPGAGKTTFAARLSALLTVRTVHLDDYLRRNCIGFTDYLRYNDLQRALLERPVIVEGVCMLEVLDRLALRPDQFVYLQASSAGQPLTQSHPLVQEVSAYTDRLHPEERANLFLVGSGFEPKKCKTRAGQKFNIDRYLMKRRSQIALALAGAGMIMLTIGAIFVVAGSSAQGVSLARIGAEDPSLVGTGLTTILMSSLWILLACAARR